MYVFFDISSSDLFVYFINLCTSPSSIFRFLNLRLQNSSSFSRLNIVSLLLPFTIISGKNTFLKLKATTRLKRTRILVPHSRSRTSSKQSKFRFLIDLTNLPLLQWHGAKRLSKGKNASTLIDLTNLAWASILIGWNLTSSSVYPGS